MVASAGRGEADMLERILERIPAAFAVTRGERHTLLFANAAFMRLVAPAAALVPGAPVGDAFAPAVGAGLTALLDRAWRTGVVARNRRIDSVNGSAPLLSCTIWPEVNAAGLTEHLVVEVRPATQVELAVGLQREVAERLLVSALRDQDAAAAAKTSMQGALFVAAESRRLTASLDERETLAAMERMSLPHLGAWCIVDILDADDTMHRLAVIHPDPARQAILESLDGRWTPDLDDSFGLPAALRNAASAVVADNADAVLANAAHVPDVAEALRHLGLGALLTVPLVVRDRLIGAVTFVGGAHGRPFTAPDVALAEDLASRSALALDRARLYGEAIALRVLAESANDAKNAFLGMMSHELRTPLNAIGGYVDLIDLEIHGPVTDEQHVDLARIRRNQRYLMGLITDLLNLTTSGSSGLVYTIGDVEMNDVLADSVALVEPLIALKQLVFEGVVCEIGLVAVADREKVIQVMVNLLSNAVKFTPAGGRITIHCEGTERTVLVHVGDTGIGIPADKLGVIFDPFVQVKGSAQGPEGGVGLGLTISRNLARAMHGELAAESTLGTGSRFTLTLPRAGGATE